jgi:GTP cyclohydrolase IA
VSRIVLEPQLVSKVNTVRSRTRRWWSKVCGIPLAPAHHPGGRRAVTAPAPEIVPMTEVAVPGIDLPRVERAVREILIAIGEDPDRDGLHDTPTRVARAYAEQFTGLHQRPEDVLTTVFDEQYDEMVLVSGIEVSGTCEHHLLPFIGGAHIGYVPNEKGQIIGLSKLARRVDVYARRPQVEERMTSQIADALESLLEARRVVVVIEAAHLCMSVRGVRKLAARTVPSAVRGVSRDSAQASAEAMSLLPRNR